MYRQQSVTHEQALKKTFSGHRFVLSPIGLFKVVTAIIFLIGSILSLVKQEACSQGSLWLVIVFPIDVLSSGVIVTLLYVGAIVGLAQKAPNLWVKVDISLCVTITIVTIVISILMLSNCTTSSTVSKIPGILGIVGSLILSFTAALLFITWRNTEDDVINDPEVPANRNSTRFSVTI